VLWREKEKEELRGGEGEEKKTEGPGSASHVGSKAKRLADKAACA
jgi:hypothetical protein